MIWNQLYGVPNAGPYSIEVGPKENYASSNAKFAYINFKDGGGFARLKINSEASTLQTMFTATAADFIALNNNDARPHGLDITDDGKKAVISSEFSNSNSNQSHIFFVNLDTWMLTNTIETKIQSRGLTIYPSVGN